MRPGLTVLCITKDQAPKLMRMLQSVQGVADDIVVFDTGSKDLSPGVARLQGARVFQIEWPGSFSDALNEAMKEVQTEWTLRLDTDEWLRPESGPQIRNLMRNEDVFAYELARQDLSDEIHYSESWHLRMWRTDSRLKMQGFIHEHFPERLLIEVAGGRRIVQAPVPFLHDGFVGGNLMDKQRRNVELLRKELDVRPGQLYYEVELAMTMRLLQEPQARAMVNELADRLLNEPMRPGPFVASLLGSALIDAEDLESPRTAALLERSWQWFDACPPMLWSIAQVEQRRGNLEGLFRVLLRLEELGETDAYEREWTFDIRMIREGLWPFLAEVADKLGHDDVAARNRRRVSK